MHLRALVCVLASVLAQAQGANLCYRVTWDLSSKPAKTQLLRPVTAFPPQHVLAKSAICGVNRTAGPPHRLMHCVSPVPRPHCMRVYTGSPIPASGLWSNTGSCEDIPYLPHRTAPHPCTIPR